MLCVHTCMCMCTCEGLQTNYENRFFTMWAPEMELRSSALTTNIFTSWADPKVEFCLYWEKNFFPGSDFFRGMEAKNSPGNCRKPHLYRQHG